MSLTGIPSIPTPIRSVYRTGAALLYVASLALLTLALLRHSADLAQPSPGWPDARPGAGPRPGPKGSALWAPLRVGDPLPRIQCPQGYTATVYAEGLSSPDGLAFSPAGILHVAEETAGRVSQIGPTGRITPIITGLTSPEGIAFDDAGNLYVVEDVQAGRLIRRSPAGLTTTLATDLDAPEGVVGAPDGTLYITESNAQFVTDPADLRTRIAAVSPSGEVTRLITNTPTISGTGVAFWSYAGLAMGPDGLPYVTNEMSGGDIAHTEMVTPGALTATLALYTTDSIFVVDPATGDRALFASGLVSPEGLRFSANGDFPLYVAEEDVGDGEGRLSRVESDGSHTPLCTGFSTIEDVAVDQEGRLYVSEDSSGLVLLIQPAVRYGLRVTPATDARSGDPGARVTYTLQVTNNGNVSDTFDVRAGGHSWTTTPNPTTVGPLVAGDSAELVVTVTIPTSATGGATDVTAVTVTSQGDDTVTATSILTTTVRKHGVFLPLIVKSAIGHQRGSCGSATAAYMAAAPTSLPARGDSRGPRAALLARWPKTGILWTAGRRDTSGPCAPRQRSSPNGNGKQAP
jgi:sugar lactone lactonase YvrE